MMMAEKATEMLNLSVIGTQGALAKFCAPCIHQCQCISMKKLKYSNTTSMDYNASVQFSNIEGRI